jgi:hypothetical protein
MYKVYQLNLIIKRNFNYNKIFFIFFLKKKKTIKIKKKKIFKKL